MLIYRWRFNTCSSCLYSTASLLPLLLVFKGLVDYLDDWNTEGLQDHIDFVFTFHSSFTFKIQLWCVSSQLFLLLSTQSQKNITQHLLISMASHLLQFFRCQSQQPVNINTQQVSTEVVISLSLTHTALDSVVTLTHSLTHHWIGVLTMSTSPPPRISGMDSAWMSVGNLKERIKPLTTLIMHR